MSGLSGRGGGRGGRGDGGRGGGRGGFSPGGKCCNFLAIKFSDFAYLLKCVNFLTNMIPLHFLNYIMT